MTGWRDLREELAAWDRAGRTASLWWRDDDAVEPGSALDRLIALTAAWNVPLSLAVVPARASRGLARRLDEKAAAIAVLQHGFDHRNHARPGEKSIELAAHRPRVAICEELARGQAMLTGLFGKRALPVLVPPWNRMAGWLVPELPALGFHGLSMHTARRGTIPAKGLTACNTHADVLRWKPERGFVGENEALELLTGHLRARRRARGGKAGGGALPADPEEPTGVLTHHAVLDEAAWAFLARLLEALAGAPAVRWVSAEEAFAGHAARESAP